MDIFDFDIIAVFTEKAISQLLDRLGISWQKQMDRLKGLRKKAWFRTFLKVKEEVESAIRKKYGGQVLTVTGSKEDEGIFLARKLSKLHSTAVSGEKRRFVMGKLKDLSQITDNLLSGYKRQVELWNGTPVLHFKKTINSDEVEIGIRAPLVEYGKAYRVWMRVNGVHMYPSKPIRIGKVAEAYVLRTYHTKKWRENLGRHLKYFKALEERAVRIVNAARRIDATEIHQLLVDSELPAEEMDELEEQWSGGSLWDLVEEVSKINRTAGLLILKKSSLLE